MWCVAIFKLILNISAAAASVEIPNERADHETRVFAMEQNFWIDRSAGWNCFRAEQRLMVDWKNAGTILRLGNFVSIGSESLAANSNSWPENRLSDWKATHTSKLTWKIKRKEKIFQIHLNRLDAVGASVATDFEHLLPWKPPNKKFLALLAYL